MLGKDESKEIESTNSSDSDGRFILFVISFSVAFCTHFDVYQSGTYTILQMGPFLKQGMIQILQKSQIVVSY